MVMHLVKAHNGKLSIMLLVFLLLGCATIPQGPVQPDEVRLVDLKISKTGAQSGGRGSSYKAIIGYQHGEKIVPGNITSACTTWIWLRDA